MTRLSEREQEVLDALDFETWYRPMDIGGSNRSDHSSVLKRLIRKGFVERKSRGALGGSRGSYVYRRKQIG